MTKNPVDISKCNTIQMSRDCDSSGDPCAPPQTSSLGSENQPMQPIKTETSKAEDLICLYPSKKCTNKRARKKNGELHTMCEYHRIRANENQRRLERRRRELSSDITARPARPTLWNRRFPEPLPLATQSPVKQMPTINDHPWPPIEMEILRVCLLDENASTQTPISVSRRRRDNVIDLSQLPFDPSSPTSKCL